MAILEGYEPPVTTKKGQVYQVTHGGEGYPLPYMRRSFISFSFGGKNIEDYNLIATIVNDRLDRQGYASFNDITSQYDLLNGQQYWGTTMDVNNLDLVLATDGISQNLLDEFLHVFSPGNTQELILAEHPNRAILARVAEAPTLSLLPFEDVVSVMISNHSYDVHTTLYKGEINLRLVMDQPYWYSKTNILGKKVSDVVNGSTKYYYIDKWTDVSTGREVDLFTSQDALKILYEDGIPLGSMIQSNMLLGNGTYADVEDDITTKIWNPNYTPKIPNYNNIDGGGAVIMSNNGTGSYIGKLAGAIIDASGNGIEELDSGESAYFYYSGNAPAPTIISFSFTPQLNNEGYISVPRNSHTSPKYNTLTIESVNKEELRFTTPNILTSYNKVIEIFKGRIYTDTANHWEDVRLAIRNNVRHQRVREYAIKVIDANKNTDIKTDGLIDTIISSMILFLKNPSDDSIAPFKVTFNSETGEAQGEFKCRNTSNSFITVKEDIGDMLCSNYLIIRDRNYPTSTGTIMNWTSAHKEYSHRIYHNLGVPISQLTILYKNMYL